MLSATRDNRLSSAWRCTFCSGVVDARTFRLDPLDCTKLICPMRPVEEAFCGSGRTKASSGRNRGPSASCDDSTVSGRWQSDPSDDYGVYRGLRSSEFLSVAIWRPKKANPSSTAAVSQAPRLMDPGEYIPRATPLAARTVHRPANCHMPYMNTKER